MIPSHLKIASATSIIALCSLASSLSAQVLMLDFGPTTATGGNLTNSPYHTAGSGFTDSTWNKVQTADITSGLLFADNSAATGVEVDLGRSSFSDKNILTFAGAPIESALGTSMNTGVYTGNSVGKDAIFYNNTGNDSYVGITISGLSAGQYDIYITGANTNSSSNQMSFWGIATATNASFDASAYLASPHGTITNSDTASWAEGINYAKLSITSTLADDQLTIFAKGTGTELRGFINSIQVVSVPEPTTSGLIFGSVILATTLTSRRRTRKS